MCQFENCTSKKNYNNTLYCYRHRGQVKKVIVEEVVAEVVAVEEVAEVAQINKLTTVKSFEASNISESEKSMSPNSATMEPTTLATKDSTILDNKETYFKSLGFILGNVKLQFLENGKKKVAGCSKWKELNRSENITGPNFLIRTGIKSFITVFDVDIKPDYNGAENLLDAGIDFDEYLDDCIKVKTQSGGFHYIFKYDQRFNTGANCFGIKGFDIRNDEGVIFAGDRYDIVSIGNKFEKPTCMDEIFDTLSANESESEVEVKVNTEPKPEVKQAVHNAPSASISEKYYELLNLLSDEWFNDFDKWVKPIYALKNSEDIDNDTALSTIIHILHERSNCPNETETKRVFNLDNSKKKFNIGSIINILKKNDDTKELWKEWNAKWYPKKEESEKKDTPLDILREKLIKIVKNKYKREFQTGVIYENILPYYYTRKYDDPAEFLNVIFCNEPMFHTCKSQDHLQLLYFIKNIINPEFEFIKLDYNYIGFKNGIYDLTNASFIQTADIIENIQVRTYIDSNFEINNDYAPLLDQYLKFQFDDETIEFIYFMIGRSMTRLNDKFDFMIFLFGEGGSGKSLLMNLLKYTFANDQIGILSNSHQEQFGSSEFTNKQIVCCDDMDNLAKTLPKADFLSMGTRGSVQCPVKGKGSITIHDWNIPTIINSNKLPNYTDKSGEVVRRFMVANFEKIIPEESKNTNLETDIKEQEFGVFLHRCRSTYLKFCAKYKNKGVESFCPISFIENRNLLRMATNNTYQFISEKCKYQEGASMSVPQLNKSMKEYIKERYDMKQMPKDTINVQNILLVDNRFEEKKLNICKSCRQEHKKGCCNDYDRVNRSKSHVILNITYSYDRFNDEDE